MILMIKNVHTTNVNTERDAMILRTKTERSTNAKREGTTRRKKRIVSVDEKKRSDRIAPIARKVRSLDGRRNFISGTDQIVMTNGGTGRGDDGRGRASEIEMMNILVKGSIMGPEAKTIVGRDDMETGDEEMDTPITKTDVVENETEKTHGRTGKMTTTVVGPAGQLDTIMIITEIMETERTIMTLTGRRDGQTIGGTGTGTVKMGVQETGIGIVSTRSPEIGKGTPMGRIGVLQIGGRIGIGDATGRNTMAQMGQTS